MKTHLLHHLLTALLGVVFAAELHAQPTTFTYQGQFAENGTPATGLYDFSFSIWDNASGPSQVGLTLTNNAVPVSDGVFTVTLDFGAGVFDGGDRWLEIGVATNGSGVFTNLSPRQQITSAPYAIQAVNAASAASVAAENISGTIPLAQLPTTVVTNGTSGVSISGTFSGDGSGLTNVVGDNLGNHIATQNIDLNGHYLSGSGVSEGVFVATNGNVGIGSVLPQARLDVSGNGINSGLRITPTALGPVITYKAYQGGTKDLRFLFEDQNGTNNEVMRIKGNFNTGRVGIGVTNPATALEVNGTVTATAFVGSGSGLTMLNAAGLTGTVALAQLPSSVVTNGASGVNISGTFTGDGSGLTSLDSAQLTGPLSLQYGDPVNTSRIHNGGAAHGVAVSGNYVYLANDIDGLRVYDISRPANPVNVGYTNDGGVASGVAVSGNYAYLANSFDGLRVYDISNPANPVNVGHTNDGGAAQSVTVAGNYAYLANQIDGLRVYEISNPANPVNVGHTNDGGAAQGVAVAGNYAYLANDADGLRVYDISNPTNLINVGQINDGMQAIGVAVAGNYAFLADRFGGLRVYDISNPTNLINVAHIDDGGEARMVEISGNYAYLANWDDGLRVYDISNPADPINVGHTDNGGNAFGLAVSGNYVYLANYIDGLRVYALADLAASIPMSVPAIVGDGTGLKILGLGGTAPVGITQNQVGGSSTMELTTTDSSGLQATRLLLRGGDDASDVEFYAGARGSETNTLFIEGSNGNVGIGTNAPQQRLHVVGNILASGDMVATAFNPTSDRNAKENFDSISPTEVLAKVAALPIQQWNFKTDAHTTHIGPMAQDFYAAFGVGPDDKHIATVDADGVALAAIQGLNQKVESGKQKAEIEIEALKAENAKLRGSVNELKALVEAMNHKLNGGAR